MRVLEWRLNPVTVAHWANWYMLMWDTFAEYNLANLPLFASCYSNYGG